MYDTNFSEENVMYIEADSRLSAMETFLDALRENPAARSLLLAMTDQVTTILTDWPTDERECRIDASALRCALSGLRSTLLAVPDGKLPTEASLKQMKRYHQRCQREFSRFFKATLHCGHSKKADRRPVLA